MEAAAQNFHTQAGLNRLLAHCEVLGRMTCEEPGTPQCRLEAALGSELTHRLLGALTGAHGKAILPV
jgi:hypothetical protein